MRNKIIPIIVFISCCIYLISNSLYASNTNGNLWRAMGLEARKGYVVGFIEGSISLGTELLFKIDNSATKAQIEKSINMFDLKSLSAEEIVEGVDSFYSDYANIKINMDEAVEIVIRRYKGESDSAIQKRIEILRQVSAKNLNGE